MTGILIKKGKFEHRHIQRGMPCEDSQGEDSIYISQGERPEADSPSQSSERTNPANTLIF